MLSRFDVRNEFLMKILLKFNAKAQRLNLSLCAFAPLRLCVASLILCVLFFAAVHADPWGKDADLAHCKPNCSDCSSPPPTLLTRLGICAIRFHQEVISPADGPRSHYIPSSSQYTLDAMRKYGFFKGFTMGCDRLMRENDDPWVYRKTVDGAGRPMKWDPVP